MVWAAFFCRGLKGLKILSKEQHTMIITKTFKSWSTAENDDEQGYSSPYS